MGGPPVNGFAQLSLADPSPPTTLVFYDLTAHGTRDELRALLLFTAEDLVDYDILPQELPAKPMGYARFRTAEAAAKAHDLLKGKLVVKLSPLGIPAGATGSRRNTVDSASARQSIQSSITSPVSASARLHSRYFESPLDSQRSTPNGTAATLNGAATKNWGLSQSPPVSTTVASRNVGRTMITGEGNDDDGLLQEAVGQGTSNSAPRAAPRRPTNPPTSMSSPRHAVSLNTNGNASMSSLQHMANTGAMSPPPQHFPAANGPMSPQGLPHFSPYVTQQTPYNPNPATAMSPMPAMPNMSGGSRPHSAYTPFHGPPPNLPPPPYNPSDQNPPCNTLYVGNLPADASEDELKHIFQTRTRGFKRLCFRVKHNGPMCFVEFEDVTMATRALNDLYGAALSNSVKGGIRLSFSKNPLGVRSNQQSATGPAPGANAGGMSTYGGPISTPPGLTRPPPGLPVPSQSNTYPYANGVSGQGPSNGYPQRPAGSIGQASNGQFAAISGASVSQGPGSPFNPLPNNGVGFLPNGIVGARNDNYAIRRNNDVGSDDGTATITNGNLSNGASAAFNGHYYTPNGHNQNGH